jgi:hypothetical protein
MFCAFCGKQRDGHVKESTSNGAVSQNIGRFYEDNALWLSCPFVPVAGPAQESTQKSEVPIAKWARKVIMLIGAHADDDAMSHGNGTLAMLQAHGNQIYIVTLTTGNMGTQDPTFSASVCCRSTRIRRS